MRISVVGTGYVGLVSGVCLAEKGHEVLCVDIDQAKVDRINAGESPIHEDGLEALLKKHVGKRLQASTDLDQAVRESEVSLIAVGTPFKGDAIDLRFIRQVSEDIGRVLADKEDYHVVVVKSTVVPGTTDSVVLPLLEAASGKKAGEDFGVGMNPEFLREGVAVEDFMDPDRIVLGGIDERSLEVMQRMYSVFDGVDVVRTNPRTAEMIKYTANSLLATMISFANEVGNLCAATGEVDVIDVMNGVHLDKRLSPITDQGRITPSFTTYIEAGCGFGGSCFPKDVKALVAHGRERGMPMDLLGSVMVVNEQQPMRMISLLKKHFPELKGVKVAVLGLAFKPGTDDIRESPSIPIIQALLDENADVVGFDPIAEAGMKHLYPVGQIRYADSVVEAIDGVDAILLVTRWKEFEDLPEMLSTMTKAPLLVDGRRMLDKQSVEHYEGIGL
ncbi:MAG: UDP-glucose/GDP-mannose dehydrogenase family protein [Verrucomicrobiota bacterium]